MIYDEIAKLDEKQSRFLLESIYWPERIKCPHCENSEKSYCISGESSRSGLYTCGKCRKQFTVTTKTLFHRTRLPIKKLLMMTHDVCANRCIAANEISKKYCVNYRTAFNFTRSIRLAPENEPLLKFFEITIPNRAESTTRSEVLKENDFLLYYYGTTRVDKQSRKGLAIFRLGKNILNGKIRKDDVKSIVKRIKNEETYAAY